MAAPMLRLSWSVLSKCQIRNSRALVCAYTNYRHPETREYFTQQKRSRNFSTAVKDFLTYSVLISGIGYALYKWRDEFHEKWRSLSLVPAVHAKWLPPSDVNNNRNKYNFIADVVEISAPAVVYIEVIDSNRTDFYTGKPGTASNGSGFIVQEDGLILTNAHVVITKPNTRVKVRLHDGSTYTGTVEDVDMQSDLATVRINKNKLPVMKLGKSSNIRPGEFVVAIGSPLALSNTITSGVVSANRQSTELGLYNKHMEYIQTDAAITFGNSGGPLVNLDGEAIGINAMKVTAGISFAIPIDYAKEFLKKAEERRANRGIKGVTDASTRRYMGITMLSLTPDLIHELQRKNIGIPFSIKHGVLVWKVVVSSPAYAGGLRGGDIITHVDGDLVTSVATIYTALEKPGPLHLDVVRDGQVLHLKIQPEDI